MEKARRSRTTGRRSASERKPGPVSLEGIQVPVIPIAKRQAPVVIKKVYRDLVRSLNPQSVLKAASRNGETPFGYVIDHIKDMYGYTKAEAWLTAEAVCKHFNFKT